MAKKKSEFEVIEQGPLTKKSDNAAVRINLVSIDGTLMFDLRQYYRVKDSKEWLPTGKGFTLPMGPSALKAVARFRKFVKANLEE